MRKETIDSLIKETNKLYDYTSVVLDINLKDLNNRELILQRNARSIDKDIRSYNKEVLKHNEKILENIYKLDRLGFSLE